MRNMARWGWSVVCAWLVGCGGLREAPPPPAAPGVEAQALTGLAAPHRVKDIFLPTRSSSPAGFVTLGRSVFFSAGDERHGRELWKSDGTRDGTVLVKDLRPGASGGDPRQLTRVGNRLFFVTGGEEQPTRLWRSDGTEAGTVPVKEFAPKGGSLAPIELTAVAGTLYFGLGGTEELWKSDGTPEGTVRLYDLWTDGGQAPYALREVRGRLFFLSKTPPGGVALWTSEGTRESTVRLREFLPATQWSKKPVGQPFVLGGRLILPVNTLEGARLWRSDGTVEGTQPVGPAFRLVMWEQGAGAHPVRVGDTLFFIGWDATNGHALWRSDGTDAGTRLVKNLFPEEKDSLSSVWLMGAQNTLYLQRYDGRRRVHELWKSDGSEAGTVYLQDLVGALCCDLGLPRMAMGEAVYVVASPQVDVSREQLWRIDGTAGAQLLQDFVHPGAGRQVVLGAGVDGQLVFTADDGRHGGELWRSDGTKPGTRLVTDLRTETGGADLAGLTAVKDTLFFSASEGEASRRLWTSDGSAEGTRRVEPVLPDEVRAPTDLLEVAGMLYFLAQDERGRAQVWKSDGTRAGSVRLSQFDTDATGPLVHLDGRLYFWNFGGPRNRWSLWSSDGTQAGLSLVKETWIDNPRDAPPELFVWKNALYFGGEQSVDYGLWRSDGTEAGTGPIQRFPFFSPAGEPSGFIDLGDSLIFRSGENLGSWWKSDGTTEGTVRLRDAAGDFILMMGGTVRMAGATFFTAYSTGRWALWKNPGHDLAPELIAEDVDADELVNVDGTLFFLGKDERHGAELWRSDGTRAGTRLFKELRPGPEGSWPQALTVVDGRLLLSADDGVHGREPWGSDGTEAGTRLLADLSPGEASSSPALFTRAGDSLFFKATDVAHGEELWRMSLSAAVEPPVEPVPVPATPPTSGSGPTETPSAPSTDAVPVPVPDAKLEALGCGVASGLQGSLWSGLLLLGWLRARRRQPLT